MVIDGVGVLVMDSGAGGSFHPVPAAVRELLDSFGEGGDFPVGPEDAPFDVVDRLVFARCLLGEGGSGLAYHHELAHKNGTPARFRELFERPSAHAVVSAPAERDRDGVDVFPGLHIYALQHERDVLWQNRVAHALVECHGLVGGGHPDDDACVMVCNPAFAEQLDPSSDALAPVSGRHGDARHVCDVPSEGLHGFVYHRHCLPREKEACGLRGYVLGWADERGAYECFVSERPYESRPERAVVLDAGRWDLFRESYGDLLGKQPDGFLCLQFVAHGPDKDFHTYGFDGSVLRGRAAGGSGVSG